MMSSSFLSELNAPAKCVTLIRKLKYHGECYCSPLWV